MWLGASHRYFATEHFGVVALQKVFFKTKNFKPLVANILSPCPCGIYVGDKMVTNDPNWYHIICKSSVMVNLTCIIFCATNISSLKILILMFQRVEIGSSWVGLQKSLASKQSGWYKDMYKDSDGRICGSQWGILAQVTLEEAEADELLLYIYHFARKHLWHF